MFDNCSKSDEMSINTIEYTSLFIAGYFMEFRFSSAVFRDFHRPKKKIIIYDNLIT